MGKDRRPEWKPLKLTREQEDKILRWAGRAESREKLLDILVPYIRVRGVQFLDEWLLQAISAKSDANAPPEEKSKVYWLITLAGNLIWAASCFIPGAGILKAPEVIRGALVWKPGGMTSPGKGFYATMQVGGGILAAGTVEQVKKQVAADSSGAPTGKDIIAEKLNEQRKKLGAQFEKSISSFGGELARFDNFQPDVFERDRVKFLAAVDLALWDSIFPSIGYEDLSSFYQTALSTINSALGDFKHQYKGWSEARLRFAMNKGGAMARTGRGPPKLTGGAMKNGSNIMK